MTVMERCPFNGVIAWQSWKLLLAKQVSAASSIIYSRSNGTLLIDLRPSRLSFQREEESDMHRYVLLTASLGLVPCNPEYFHL